MFAYSALDFRLAERFCAVALGADAFYRALPSDQSAERSLRGEGLVPVDFSGVAPRPVTSWREAIDELADIYRAYGEEGNGIRRNYMWQQVASFQMICRWLSGEPVFYRELVRQTMYIDENPAGSGLENRHRQRLTRALAEKGYTGPLESSVALWQADRAVRGKEAVEQLLREQLLEARERTVAIGLDVAADYDVTPQVVCDVPYNAYCDFAGRAIYINGDVEYSRNQLKHLVCHEAFPGHMTHLALRRRLVEAGSVPPDAGLVITNTASSPVFEGIGDNGMAFIGWDGGVDDRICHELTALQAISGLNAAHMLHAQGASADRAREYLMGHGFGGERWADARIRFLTDPLRIPFIYAYWRGRDGVERVWKALPEERRPAFLSYLYNNMHSIDTAAQFDDADRY